MRLEGDHGPFQDPGPGQGRLIDLDRVRGCPLLQQRLDRVDGASPQQIAPGLVVHLLERGGTLGPHLQEPDDRVAAAVQPDRAGDRAWSEGEGRVPCLPVAARGDPEALRVPQ